MFKKIIFVCLLCICISQKLFAKPGIFVNMHTGYNMTNGSFRAMDFYNNKTLLASKFAERGYLGGFALGYGRNWGPIYLGTELNFMLDSTKFNILHTENHNDQQPAEEFSLQNKNQYGGGFRIGYMTPSNLLVFFRLGAEKTGFIYSYTIKSLEGAEAIFKTKSQVSPVYSIGVEASITDNLSARFDVRYVNSLTENLYVDTKQSDGTYYQSHAFTRVAKVQILAGFTWTF
ncbi:MAG: outer membrane beta-barrel protein [Candidatus Paracaedibacteraceae bacterium]|nr:outer membrane beta-barrel protein [Candidatus Paracaedibacteraceae bacterium]